MEQKNRIDHYKIQSVLLWFGICFFVTDPLASDAGISVRWRTLSAVIVSLWQEIWEECFLCDIRNHDVSDAVDILYHGNSQDCKKKRRECIYDNTKV